MAPLCPFLLVSVSPSSFSGLAGFARLCAGDQYEVGNAQTLTPERRCILLHLICAPPLATP